MNSASNTTDNSIAHSLVFEDDYVISPRIVNTARYYYLSHNLYTTPSNLNTELIYPDYSFGQNPTLPQYFPRTNHTIGDTLFISGAKNDIKIGGELTKVFSTYQSHYYEHGQFTFTSDAPFKSVGYRPELSDAVHSAGPNGNYFYSAVAILGICSGRLQSQAEPDLEHRFSLRLQHPTCVTISSILAC